jgi:hypothetical protein
MINDATFETKNEIKKKRRARCIIKFRLAHYYRVFTMKLASKLERLFTILFDVDFIFNSKTKKVVKVATVVYANV